MFCFHWEPSEIHTPWFPSNSDYYRLLQILILAPPNCAMELAAITYRTLSLCPSLIPLREWCTQSVTQCHKCLCTVFSYHCQLVSKPHHLIFHLTGTFVHKIISPTQQGSGIKWSAWRLSVNKIRVQRSGKLVHSIIFYPWDIFITFGRNKDPVKMVSRMQEWMLSLASFWSDSWI